MTLNITIATGARVYQSSDFRLVNGDTGEVVTNSSTKAVQVTNTTFSAMMTYTGVGRWRSRDTAEWIVDWLKSLGDCSLQDALSGVEKGASRWVRSIGRDRHGKPYPFTLVMATFSYPRTNPEIHVVSNFETASGEPHPDVGNMRTTTISNIVRPRVLITGFKKAVPRERRRWLGRFVSTHQHHGGRIRAAMMQCNAVAAASPAAEDTISPGCTVISTDSSGRGFQDVSPDESVEVYSLHRGSTMFDVRQVLKDLGIEHGQIKAATFGRFGPDIPTHSPEPCEPVQVDDSDEYDLVELSPPGAARAQASAISDSQLTVGWCKEHEQTSVHRFWQWSPTEGVTFLPVANSGGSVPLDINESGTVCGSANANDGHLQAFTWRNGHEVNTLERAYGRGAAAHALNVDGVVVGWASISDTERGQLHNRPAVWTPDGESIVMNDVSGDWGYAKDVADDGTALLCIYRGHTAHPALRHPDGTLEVFARSGGIIPVSLLPHCVVLGVANTKQGRLPVVADGDHRWEPLGMDYGWEPTAVGPQGHVAGHAEHKGFSRPWLREASGRILLLPHYEYHRSGAHDVNGNGDVVGVAGTEDCTHALLWRRRET